MKRTVTGIAAAALALGTLIPAAFAGATTTSGLVAAGGKTINYNGTALYTGVQTGTQMDAGTTTQYFPIYYLMQTLTKAGYTNNYNSTTHQWDITMPGVDASKIAVDGGVGTGNGSISINGTVVKKFNVAFHKDFAGGPSAQVTTYFPLYYLGNVLKASGFTSAWDGTNFNFMQAAASSFTAKQTAASKVEVDFNGPVASGTAVTLSQNGINYTVTPTWNSTNNVVTLDTGYNLPAGTYTVTAGSLTGTVTIATSAPAAIKLSTGGFAAVDGAPLNFTVVDQFGNTITDYNALNIVAYDANNGEQFTPATTSTTSATFNFKTGGVTPVAVGDKIVVSVTDSTAGVSASATLPVVGTTNISSFKLGAATDNSSSKVQAGDPNVSLAYTAADAGGNAVTLPAGSGSTIGGIEFLSSASNVVDPSTFAVDSNGNLTFQAGAAGSAIITAVNLNTGTSSTTTVTVTDSSTVQSFHVSGPSKLVTAGTGSVLPYTAVDGTGAQISQANFGSSDQGQVKWLSSDDTIVNPATDISYDSSNNLTVTPEKAGTVTLTATINGVVQNSVALNVQAAAYPVSLNSVTGENRYMETGANTQTLDASNLTLVNQYGQAYSPASTDSITIVPTSGTGNVTVAATTNADGAQPANGAKVYGDGSVTFTGAVAGDTVFKVTVSNGTQSASYSFTVGDVASTAVTSYKLDTASTLYDGAAGFPSASPALTIANYEMPVNVDGVTSGGQAVTLAGSPVAYVTSSDTSIVGVNGTSIEGLAKGSATVTAYDNAGNKLASGTVTVAEGFPVAKTVSFDTDSIDESGAAVSTDITSAILGHLTVTDQYGANYPTNGYWISSDPSIIKGGSTVQTTTATTGSVTLTYVTNNGITASVTVSR